MRLRAFLEPEAAAPQAVVAPAHAAVTRAASAAPAAMAPVIAAVPAGKQILELVFGPLGDAFTPKEVDGVVGDLKDFGTVQEITTPEQQQAGTERRFSIVTEVSASDLSDAIAFMADPAFVKVLVPAPAAAADTPRTANDTEFGLFVDAAALPANQREPAAAAPETKAAAARVAEKLSLAALVGDLNSTYQELKRSVFRQNKFLVRLNKMVFNAASASERRNIFGQFYSRSENIIERFYAMNLRPQDRMRILLGRPPVSFARAVRSMVPYSWSAR